MGIEGRAGAIASTVYFYDVQRATTLGPEPVATAGYFIYISARAQQSWTARKFCPRTLLSGSTRVSGRTTKFLASFTPPHLHWG